MKKFSCLLLLILLSLSSQVVNVHARSKAEAEKLLQASVNEVLAILSDKELPKNQKKSKVLEITNEIFNFGLMAKLSLGKEHWSRFNPEQRAEFTEQFIELVQHIYTSKLDLFSDEKVLFDPIEVLSEKKVQIPTVLISRGKKFSVLYKMAKSKEEWQVYDVEIEGVSVVHTYRSQYNHILSSGTAEDLLKIMKEKNIENRNKGTAEMPTGSG